MKHTILAVALCALTGAALAQTQPASPPMAPGATSPTAPATAPSATPPTTTTAPAATTTTPSGSSAMRLPSRSEPADAAYRSLDAANRGYLSKTDVQGIQGFDFDQADTNRDGRISKDEFTKAWAATPTK